MSSNSWTMIIKIAIILIFMHTSHVMVNRCMYEEEEEEENKREDKSFVLQSRYLDINIDEREREERGDHR